MPAAASFFAPFLRLFAAVNRLGRRPDDTDDIRLQKTILVSAVVFGGLPVQLVIGAVSLTYAEFAAAGIALGGAIFSLASLIFFTITKRGFEWFKVLQLGIAMVSPCLGTLALGGITDAGYSILWSFTPPAVGFIYYHRARQVLYWYLAFLIVVAVCVLAEPHLREGNTFPPAAIHFLMIFNTAGISAMIFGGMVYFTQQRDEAFRLLRLEREKADNLLLNILPPEIAALLKDRDGIIADQFEGASILFADVVDFTSLAERLAPARLVSLLNEVFSHFDALVDRYGLEKIKTIGDCYMVAAGVPRPRPDHAAALARLALDMQDFVGRRRFLGHALQLRIGINSGPVVAGVIGRKKFIYDLWGDAVNTASRMESQGRPGAIQITRPTYELIREAFRCEARGTVAVKGKGELEVWEVSEAHSPLSRDT